MFAVASYIGIILLFTAIALGMYYTFRASKLI